MDNLTYEMRLAHWTELVREKNNSGMTVKEWCAANNIGEKKYFYWQRRVRKAVAKNLSLPAPPGNNQESPFVEIPLPAPAGADSADIILRMDNCILEIHNSTSEALLNMLLKAVAHVK